MLHNINPLHNSILLIKLYYVSSHDHQLDKGFDNCNTDFFYISEVFKKLFKITKRIINDKFDSNLLSMTNLIGDVKKSLKHFIGIAVKSNSYVDSKTKTFN